jgi:glucose-1-phosphate adenylyltransferase
MRSQVICIIMGGGRGTRLYPLTKGRCKPAVPLAGKYRLVDIPISNCINSGLNKIYLLTQFNTASLHRHIRESYKFDSFGGGFVDILAAEQTDQTSDWYQGTADCVRKNLEHFHAKADDIFLILSGDQLYRMDFRSLIEQHLTTGAEVTIPANPVPTERASSLGIMRVRDDLSISEFVEKPKDPKIIQKFLVPPAMKETFHNASEGGLCLANMGIYVFSRKALFDALDNNLVDFGREVIPSLLGKVPMYGFIFDDYWEDIGTIESFFEANLALADDNPPFEFFEEEAAIYTRARFLPSSKVTQSSIDRAIVSDGVMVNRANIKRCVLGLRTLVGEGTALDNVVTMGNDHYQTFEEKLHDEEKQLPHIGIGKNCRITHAIIDKNARIGDNVVLSPEGKPDLFEKDGVIVRDGVLCVVRDAIIPSGTII